MNSIQEKIILNNHIDSLCDLYVKGKFYTVIQTTKKLLLIYEDSVALLNILGMSNAKINKYEDAIVNYKKAIELSPENATIFFHLGILYHDLNQYNKAIQDRAAADELAKRCLGAIEVLQGLIGEEESKEEVEAEIVE